ncbi:hypothetical protein KCU77_g105, partial [Aureobasidium melanogenum]
MKVLFPEPVTPIRATTISSSHIRSSNLPARLQPRHVLRYQGFKSTDEEDPRKSNSGSKNVTEKAKRSVVSCIPALIWVGVSTQAVLRAAQPDGTRLTGRLSASKESLCVGQLMCGLHLELCHCLLVFGIFLLQKFLHGNFEFLSPLHGLASSISSPVLSRALCQQMFRSMICPRRPSNVADHFHCRGAAVILLEPFLGVVVGVTPHGCSKHHSLKTLVSTKLAEHTYTIPLSFTLSLYAAFSQKTMSRSTSESVRLVSSKPGVSMR